MFRLLVLCNRSLILIGAVCLGSIGSCVSISYSSNKAFESVEIGNSERQVIGVFGALPSVREKGDTSFERYISTACSHPCQERIWFENRLSFDTEAWFFELDNHGVVIRKAHIVSP